MPEVDEDRGCEESGPVAEIRKHIEVLLGTVDEVERCSLSQFWDLIATEKGH